LLSRFAAVPLLSLLPLVWRAGLGLARRATRDERLARFLAPGAALALWAVAVHAIGLARHSFYLGLFLGTLLCAGLGLWSYLRKETPIPQTPSPPAGERAGVRGPLRRTSPWMWVGMAAATLVLLGPELRYSEHDECLNSGHISIPLEMQNGVYPPRNLTFSNYEIRYHYAADLVAAALSSMLGRLNMVASVHLLALLLWAYTFSLFWLLGERFVGGGAGPPVMAFGVLFAGGAPFFCHDYSPLSSFLVSDCHAAGTWITPPVISNFLQHPWSLGIPLFAGILLLLPGRATGWRNPWWWGLLSLLCLLLSFAQVVLFVCLLPAIVVTAATRGWWLSLRRLLVLAVWAALVFAGARLLHGFFASVAEPKGTALAFQPIWRDTPLREVLSWNLQSLGLLLPLGLLGLWALRRERLLLSVLAVGGLLARNLFRYEHSWDIVKFSMVTQLALAVLACAALAQAFASRRLRIPGGAAFATMIFFGVTWPAALTLDLRGIFFCKQIDGPPPPADQQAIDLLRPLVREGEAVYRTDHGNVYALYGGIPQPHWDWGVESFGFSQSLYDERHRLLADPPDSPAAFRAQGFRFLVLGPSDAKLAGFAARWAQQGKARLLAKFPPLEVYRLE